MTTDVIVVGAGITGVGAAYHLGAAGLSYVVLEAAGDVGGVWRTQRWHGARCDSDVVKYSFSFKPLLSPHCLANQNELHAYLRSVVDEFGLLEHIRFDTRVTKAVFDVATATWSVHTDRGIFTSRFLLNGNGYVGDAHVPAFPDAATFRGEIVHTAALDGTRTFSDRDVVLVGSGSAAICAAPALSRVARSLVLLQRSPSYIYEIDNDIDRGTAIAGWLHRRGITLPVRVLRWLLQAKDDLVFVGCRRFPRAARWFFRRHWRPAVGPSFLDEHLTPRYDPWEQRICVAIGLKDKLRSGEIAMKTGAIERFTESSIVLAGGEHLKCDVVVLATGFEVQFLKFDLYVGDTRITPGGTNLYKGLMMGGVPNYFHPVGVWHSAWTQRSETATKFAIRIMAHMRAHGFRAVGVERREIGAAPGITPNYVLRNLATIPRPYGTRDLPSIDALLAWRFDPAALDFR